MNVSSHSPDLPIGIFDSGVGGLSIAQALRQLLPCENILYVADSAHAPYGDKSDAYVQARCEKIVEFLLGQKVKLVVVACNTATLSCITHLRDKFDIAFVGAEPGIKPALAASKTGVVGVMATQSTLESAQYNRLLDRYRNDKKVIQQACNGLVEQIEAGAFDSESTLVLLNKYLAPMRAQKADQIVLGCTHYHFLIPVLKKLLPEGITIIESGPAVAKQTKAILEKYNLLNSSQQSVNYSFFTNGSTGVMANLMNLEKRTIKKLD